MTLLLIGLIVFGIICLFAVLIIGACHLAAYQDEMMKELEKREKEDTFAK